MFKHEIRVLNIPVACLLRLLEVLVIIKNKLKLALYLVKVFISK